MLFCCKARIYAFFGVLFTGLLGRQCYDIVTAIIQKMLPHFLFRHFFASFFSFEGAVDLLCDHLFLENISKCTQATAHNERTIVCLHYASFLSNIP